MKITVTHKIIGDFRHEYVATVDEKGEKALYRSAFVNHALKRNYESKKCKLHKKNNSYSFMLPNGDFTHIKREHIKFEKVDEYVLKEIIETPF